MTTLAGSAGDGIHQEWRDDLGAAGESGAVTAYTGRRPLRTSAHRAMSERALPPRVRQAAISADRVPIAGRRPRKIEPAPGVLSTSIVPPELIDTLAQDIAPETAVGERCLRLAAPPDRGYE